MVSTADICQKAFLNSTKQDFYPISAPVKFLPEYSTMLWFVQGVFMLLRKSNYMEKSPLQLCKTVFRMLLSNCDLTFIVFYHLSIITTEFLILPLYVATSNFCMLTCSNILKVKLYIFCVPNHKKNTFLKMKLFHSDFPYQFENTLHRSEHCRNLWFQHT